MADGYKKLGEHLLATGQITNLQLSLALAVQRTSSRRLGEILVSKGFLTEREVAEVLCKQYNYSFVDEGGLMSQPEALALVSFEKAIQTLVLPLRVKEGHLECAIADPIDIITTDWLSRSTGMKLVMRISTPTLIAAAIQTQYSKLTSRASGLSFVSGTNLPDRYAGIAPKQGFASGVYDSHDSALNRDVCLVEFNPEGKQSEVTALVQRCAKSTSQNNCTVYDFHKQSNGSWWISTEKFAGETLAHLIETRGKRTPSQAATIVSEIASNLWEEYTENGAFGFLSPENVIIQPDGSPVLMPLSTNVESFRSPEDRERETATVQSDIFALGSLLRYCLAGHTSADNVQVPAVQALTNIISKCTAERPTDRYDSLPSVLNDLRSVNWSALATTSFASSQSFRNDRDELLRDISTWNAPRKTSFWGKLLGKKAA